MRTILKTAAIGGLVTALAINMSENNKPVDEVQCAETIQVFYDRMQKNCNFQNYMEGRVLHEISKDKNEALKKLGCSATPMFCKNPVGYDR